MHQIRTTNRNDDKNTAMTKLKNFIHPILVKKSQRYRGIPPLIKTSSAIKNINFNAITIAAMEVYLSIKEGRMFNARSKTQFVIWCERSIKPKEYKVGPMYLL